MYICDCHCDTLSKAYNEQGSIWSNNYHLDLARIIANGGGLQFWAMFLPSAYRYCQGTKYTLQMIDKYYQEIALLQAKQVDYIQVLSAQDVDNVLKHKVALLLSIEEGGAIEGSLEVLRIFYHLGVRCMTLTWNHRNDIADGVSDSASGGGLTPFGQSVVQEMNRLGMLIDVSHISPRGFWDVMDKSDFPIIASHSNSLALCGHPRNLSDEQIRALAQKQGVIGINFSTGFLANNPEQADIDHIYRHIAYMLDLVGDENLAWGSDFDGIKKTPQGIQGVEDMPRVIDYLITKNISINTIEKICFRNVLRLLKSTLN